MYVVCIVPQNIEAPVPAGDVGVAWGVVLCHVLEFVGTLLQDMNSLMTLSKRPVLDPTLLLVQLYVHVS